MNAKAEPFSEPSALPSTEGALTADVRQEDACPISSNSEYSRGEEQYDDCWKSTAISALKFLRTSADHAWQGNVRSTYYCHRGAYP